MTKLLLLAVLMAQSLPAVAATPEQAVNVRVSYSDLNLATETGRQMLDRRLDKAIASLCPDDNGIRDIARLTAIRACRADKLAQIAAPRAQALATAEHLAMATPKR